MLKIIKKKYLKGCTKMVNVDIIKMCNNVAKEFPFTLSEVYGFMAYLLVKNEENRVVNEDDLREYCRERLAKEYRGV